MVKNVAILASGNGSNTENICNFFVNSSDIDIVLIGTNNKNAFVVSRAKKLGVPFIVFTKYELERFSELQKKLTQMAVDFIVLAGFLLKIPEKMVAKYPEKIINIHPALLPKFGGKGMYGKHVHRAVIDAGEKNSGITIHFVNNKYDAGEILFQTECVISENESATSLIDKVQALELEHYPKIIAKVIKNTKKW